MTSPTPKVLTEAEADLAGLPRPAHFPLPEPDVVRLPGDDEGFSDEAPYIWAWFAHGYDTGMEPYFSADAMRAYAMNTAAVVVSERDALAVRVRELEAERDEITELNHAQWLALENVRHLAARNRNEEWAQHMLRWCTEAGSAARILRAALTTPESKP